VSAIQFLHRVPMLLALVLLGACAGAPQAPPVVEKGEPEYRVPQPPAAPAPTPPERAPEAPVAAGGALLAQASAARERGDYEHALAYLERAQRIDPHNAAVYLDLARTHTAAGHREQARSIAERGLLYCTSRAQCDALRAFTD